MLPYVPSLHNGKPVTDVIPPQAFLAYIYGASPACEGINDDAERLGVQVEKIVQQGCFRVAVVLHRRLKAHAALLGLGLGEYVETALWEALVDAPPTRVAEADEDETTDGPVRYAESEA